MKCKLIVIAFLMISLFGFGQVKDVKPHIVLKGHKHKVQGAFFSPNGKYIISHGWDNIIKIWDVETFTVIRTLRGQTDQVWCAKVSQDNKLIASGNGYDFYDMEFRNRRKKANQR